MNLPIAEFTVRSERDVKWSAQRARLLANLAGVPAKLRTKLGKAVAQVTRNAVAHGGGGTVRFAVTEVEGKDAIEVVVRDHGPGIDDVAACLQQAASQGSGLQVARTMCSDFSLQSDAEGVSVRVRQSFSPEVRLKSLPVTEWGTVLAMRTSQGALAKSQERIGELGGRLKDLQQHGDLLEKQLLQIKSLNETLELLALVASKTVNAVIILDQQGVVEWVNEGFEHMTGYAASDVVGSSFANFFHSDDGDNVSNELGQAIQAGRGISVDVQHVRKDGPIYWASLSLTPAFDDTGRPSRWICIANDVSRRREAQEELRKARDLAEAANRAKSMFLANISHEIRTPMNVVIGMTQLALDTQLTAEQREYLTAVDSSATSLLNLLNDLLDLSKIEAGKIEMDPAPFDIEQMLERSMAPLQAQAKQKRVALNWVVADEVPNVLIGDDTRLQQVLANLVSNAVKFTAAGEVRIEVESQWQSDGDIGLVFSVRDTGIGISADKLQSIFDAFTQADSSTSRHYGGSGLGLAICTHLVSLMGGRIWAESRVGEGSCFRFTVRMGVGVAGAAEPGSKPSPASANSLHVLIADDNPANRLLVERLLQKRGHRVAQAVDGRQALEMMEHDVFDVVLLDVQMPELDGFQTAALLRERERSSDVHVPVIAITASAMKSDRDRCFAAGMDAFLAKPINIAELAEVVESLAVASLCSPRLAHSEPAPNQFAAALARVENDVEILREQMQMFLSDSPTLMNRIREAAMGGDFVNLKLAAHRLRGFAANFDANDVVATAARLEEMGDQQQLHESLAGCAALESALASFRVRLEEFLREAIA